MGIVPITIILFGGMVILLFMGVPAVFAIGGMSIILTFLLRGPTALYTVASTTYGTMTDVTLLAIPMFTLMASFLIKSGIADRLFQALSYWLSGISGGLAIVTIIVSTVLAMCGGFGPGIITMCLIAIPAMLKRGYNKSLTLGSVIAGGLLGDVIPPSTIMIIFGFINRLSVGKLFIAGIIPGLILALSHVLNIWLRCRLNPKLAPRVAGDITWNMRLLSLREVILPVVLVFTILGSIFLGIATPTEAASVGALGALLCCVVNRTICWKLVREAGKETFKITGVVLWIMIAATFFGVFYTSVGARELILELVLTLPVNPWVIIGGMQIILIVLGMFLDDYAIVIIVSPIFLPIATTLGFDPIWFAIVFILNMQLAELSPPFGWALIVVRAMTNPKEITTGEIWRAVPPFALIQLLALIMVIVVPSLALWLPDKMI